MLWAIAQLFFFFFSHATNPLGIDEDKSQERTNRHQRNNCSGPTPTQITTGYQHRNANVTKTPILI